MTLFTGMTHSMSRGLNRVSPHSGISQGRIAGVASALPEHRYPQEVITAALKHHWNGSLARPELLDRLHTRAGVEYRHLAFPLEQYARFGNWGETNAAWLQVAQDLGARAIEGALERAGLKRGDLDALFVVSITGVASPSLDARLINLMRLRPDLSAHRFSASAALAARLASHAPPTMYWPTPGMPPRCCQLRYVR
jgi:predicted naringenin-chalcone synthase